VATCPRCLGPLTDDHTCRGSAFRRVRDALSTVGVGGLAGALLCFAIVDRPVTALVIAAAALGAVLAVALRQAVRGDI
jgi:hypothetical protein